MKHQFCIASSKKPISASQFMDTIKDCAREHGGLTCTAMVVCEGSGVINYGLELDGEQDEAEKFVAQLTMVLMPAKYSIIHNDPMLQTGQFTNLLD